MLRQVLANGRLPHALLFSGIDGIGKATTAKALAMAVNCEGRLRRQAVDPCGWCRSCRRIAGNLHPDVVTVAPSGPFIRIGQIRELLQVFSLKPHGSGCRVAIIRSAHALNAEAANALLKLLEEPPAGSLLVLTANRISDLIPTIVSRCHPIRFRPLAPGTVARLLVDRTGIDPSAAGTLAALSGGSLTWAMALLEAGWLKRRDWLIDTLAGLEQTSLRERLALAEILSRDREFLATAVGIASGWYRDVAVALAAPEAAGNPDSADRIRGAASRLDADRVEAALRALLTAERALDGNAGARMTAEVLVMRLAHIHGVP